MLEEVRGRECRQIRKSMFKSGKLWRIDENGLCVYIILMDGNVYRIPAPKHHNFMTYTTDDIKNIIGKAIVRWWFV